MSDVAIVLIVGTLSLTVRVCCVGGQKKAHAIIFCPFRARDLPVQFGTRDGLLAIQLQNRGAVATGSSRAIVDQRQHLVLTT